MKEISIEEKAKRYDEALENAKLILDMTSDKSAIYTIFPELAESEDEKVRRCKIDKTENMSKIDEMALEAYPVNKVAVCGCSYDANTLLRVGYIAGANAVLMEVDNLLSITVNNGKNWTYDLYIGLLEKVQELKGDGNE